jgi:uncharacterized linocin/CFP29 family protein
VNHLLRETAPISDDAWREIDTEARSRLTPALGARKLVDFIGPLGWEQSAASLGRVDPVEGEHIVGVAALRRRVLPFVELRAPFDVSREELRAIDRGAVDPDFEALDAAVERMSIAENVAVFHGLRAAGIHGLAESEAHPPVQVGEADFERYPSYVARAVEMMLSVGIDGPYGLALGPDHYTGVIETTEHGGYPLLEHLRQILGGPIVWAPGMRGGVVVSLRGGDFLFESGQDLSVGYNAHDADAVHLYLEESFSFRIATADAAVALRP